MTREFILNTLLPYKEDRNNCGFDSKTGQCFYKSSDGKRCAVGKHLTDGEHLEYGGSVIDLFVNYDKNIILTKEALDQNIPDDVWNYMQDYHDSIATNRKSIAVINSIVEVLENTTNFKFPELYF